MATRIRPAPRRSGSSLSGRLLAPLAFAGVLFVGLAVYTVVNGELRLPFGGVVLAFGGEEEAAGEAGPPKGTAAVFANPRMLPAFTKITREHLLVEDGSRLYTTPVVAQAIDQSKLFRADNDGLQRLLGRVLKRDKPVAYAFSEADFLPVGTRPGPSAGIPPGQRGVWIDVAKVQGLADVHPGDLVDLLAAEQNDAKPSVDPGLLGNLIDPVMKARLQAVADRDAKTKTASSWVVARGAKVISPPRSRPLPGNGAKRGNEATVEEVFLAMQPEDVSRFGQALAQKVTLLAAPRSSQPTDEPIEIRDDRPVDSGEELRKLLLGDEGSQGSFGMVEVIRGGARETVTVPRSGESGGGR